MSMTVRKRKIIIIILSGYATANSASHQRSTPAQIGTGLLEQRYALSTLRCRRTSMRRCTGTAKEALLEKPVVAAIRKIAAGRDTRAADTAKAALRKNADLAELEWLQSGQSG